ncbi:RPAC2 protein, partial [Sapayoa aenigma]|nr:RPAC2 protein [Sapayoa aenigma]
IQVDGTDGNWVMFVLHDKDHTLGNSLHYIVMKRERPQPFGVTVTDPSLPKRALPAVELFRKGLNDLMGVCQHILNTF